MHLPGGILSGHVSAVTALIAGSGIAYTFYHARMERRRGVVQRVALIGAFIFMTQLVNVPLFQGTSGHFLGAALAAALLGPWIAVSVMSAVLVLQCLLLSDGGFTALGANICNMAFVAVGVSYLIQRINPQSRLVLMLSAWSGVFAASGICTLQLSISGIASLPLVAQSMIGSHATIGCVEALVTVAVVSVVEGRVRSAFLRPVAERA